MKITKQEFISALNSEGVLNNRRIQVLKALYKSESFSSHSKLIGKTIGQETGTINLRFGRLGRKIAEQLNVLPEQRKNGEYQWWQILATGSKDSGRFIWTLKEELVEALMEMGVLSDDFMFPDEVSRTNSGFIEGSVKQILVNAYERNRKARAACLNHYKAVCVVCTMDFQKKYGEIGRGFMHVHHTHKISGRDGKSYTLNPILDLKPVCPNCHAMIHRRDPPFTIEEMKKILLV